jgi:hypothetical protein
MDSIRHSNRRRSLRFSFATVIVALSFPLLVLLPACGQSTSATTSTSASGTPSPAASAIPTKSVAVPGPQLAWHPTTYPPGVDPNRGSVSVSVAPGDGDIAYLCVAPTDPTDAMARTFITRDRAQSWTRGADLVVGAQPPTTNHYFAFTCDIAIDANNPASALIMSYWMQVASGVTVGLSNFASVDFAAHWQKLTPTQPQHFIADGRLSSWHGNIYALGTSQIPGGSDGGIWVSADQMRSWRRLTPPAGLIIASFWLNPSSGALLALAGMNSSSLQQFYGSDDQGATWTAIPTGTGTETGQSNWSVAAPQVGQPWHLCRVPVAVSSPPVHGDQPGTVSCSIDGGQTWTSPQPEFVYSVAFNPKAGGFWVIAVANEFAVTVDGAVLAAGDRVYRLTPGATVWQDLGLIPGTTAGYPPGAYLVPGAPTYYPTPAGGVLWMRDGSGWMVASYPAV